jgi:glycerophosphoryl diester phosphodiesterase
MVAAAGCQAWSPLYRNAKPEDIAAARSLGLKVIPWTVNERSEMERLIALGVDGLITDYPDRLRAVMALREMPLPPQVKAR